MKIFGMLQYIHSCEVLYKKYKIILLNQILIKSVHRMIFFLFLSDEILTRTHVTFVSFFKINDVTYRRVGAKTSYLGSARKNVLSQLGA